MPRPVARSISIPASAAHIDQERHRAGHRSRRGNWLRMYSRCVTRATSRLRSPYSDLGCKIGANWTCPERGRARWRSGPPPPARARTLSRARTSPPATVTNTATATAKYGDAHDGHIQSGDDDRAVPRLLLQCQRLPTSVTALGQTITYTYTLTNHTESACRASAVTDSLGTSDLHCVPDLAGGAAPQPAAPGRHTVHPSGHGCGGDHQPGHCDRARQRSHPIRDHRIRQRDADAAAAADQDGRRHRRRRRRRRAFTLPQNITYTYTLKNIGNVTLSAPYTVTDDKIRRCQLHRRHGHAWRPTPPRPAPMPRMR